MALHLQEAALDREPVLHEQASFLALGLLCAATPGAKVQLSTGKQDRVANP